MFFVALHLMRRADRNNRLKSWFRLFWQFPIYMRPFVHGPHDAKQKLIFSIAPKSNVLLLKMTVIGDVEIAFAILSVDF